MRRAFLGLALVCASPGQADDDFDPITVDVADAINCHIDARTYNRFALSLGSDEDKGAARRKWRKIKGTNPFMNEYRLPKPIPITGEYATDHIALTSSGIMAVLDLVDPAGLAKSEAIANAADATSLLDGFVEDGVLTPNEAKAMPRTNKFLGKRVLVDETERDDRLDLSFHTEIKRVISTVTSHPGKTLYGCSYKIEIQDE